MTPKHDADPAITPAEVTDGTKSGKRRRREKRGQVLVLFVLVVLMLAAVCVFTIDVGRLFVCEAELQNAVDAAALAGASQLVGGVTPQSRAAARQSATRIAAENTVEGTSLTLAESDITFGHYDDATGDFIPESVSGVVDSVQVTGRRTSDSPDGPIDLFFGPLFGWDEMEFDNVVSVGTKPRRYVNFVLDRSGSMSFDTSGVTKHSITQDPANPVMQSSASNWYWFPDLALKQTGYGWYGRTAWFYATDDATGEIRTDFLPDHIQARLDAGRYFNFRPVDYPDNVMSGWIKVPPGVTIHGRWGSPWHNWLADDYYWVIDDDCGYATASHPVQPLQNTMDAASTFVDLLRPHDDQAALVTFGWKASVDQVLTTDFDRVKIKLQSFAPCGATAEPDAMQAANNELIDSGRADGFGQRIMILLTDGKANMLNENGYGNSQRTYQFLGEEVTSEIHPTVAAAMENEARRAGQEGVRIYCVTFGNDVDTELHRLISRETDGAYYHSASHEHLTDVFVDIFRRLPPIITR
jgi:hypothetical protein